MKKFIIVSIIISMVLIFSTSSFAFENMDAESWSDLNKENKEKYLEGVIFGINFFMINMYSGFNEDVDPDLMAIQLEREGELMQPNSSEYKEMIYFSLHLIISCA